MKRYYRDSITGQLMYIDDPGGTYLDSSYQQQQQPGQQPDAMQYLDYAKQAYDMYGYYQKFAGSGQGGGAASGANMPSGPGGFGGPMAYAGIVAAAIAAQHAMSNATTRRFDGQRTKDAFGGSFMTEPWLAFGFDKLGIDSPTAGENFDAAWQNRDYHNSAERFPRALSYWGEPGSSVGYDLLDDKLGGKFANIAFPNQYGFKQLGDLFGKLF